MGRPFKAAYNLDASFMPDEEDNNLFDVSEDEGSSSDTDATDIEDPGFDVDADDDLEDQIQLFGRNVHSPEYYRQAVQELNESAFDKQDYSLGSTALLDTVEE